MSHQRISELERRLSNVIRPGTVLEADYEKARVKVKLGQNTTGWLPWMTQRAGGNREWAPPEVGEQVLVLAPAGELAQGYVVPSVFQKKHAPNGDKADVRRTDYGDGSFIEYDRASHSQTEDFTASGKRVSVTGNAKIEHKNGEAIVKVDSAEVKLTGSAIVLQIGSSKIELTSSGITITGAAVNFVQA